MRRTLIVSCLIFIASCGPRIQICGPGSLPVRDPVETEQVISSLDSLLQMPALRQTHVGVSVRSLDRNEWLVERNADRLFVPASNAKLLTATAVLHVLGPAARFATTLVSSVPPENGVVHGDICLVAGGAPDLTTADLVRMTDRIREAGITTIEGNLILDATLFDSTAWGPGWMWDEGPYSYNAPVNAFMLNHNTVTIAVRPTEPDHPPTAELTPRSAGVPIRVEAVTLAARTEGAPLEIIRPETEIVVGGGIVHTSPVVRRTRTVPDPVAYAGNVFASCLHEQGITVQGRTHTGTAPPDCTILARAYSAPVDVLVRRFLKHSDNLVGEALIKHLGLERKGTGSWRAGLSAVREALNEVAGLDSTTYRLADGSGLSRYTQVTPRQIVQVLTSAHESFHIGPELSAALPVSGTDGTLANRLRSDCESIRAKTGTMSGTSTLSGILETLAGERLAFSIMMNGFVGSSGTVRRFQDEITRTIRRFPCVRPPESVRIDVADVHSAQ